MTSFHKQQYKEIGYILAKNKVSNETIKSFEEYFLIDNPLFNKQKFEQFIN